MKNKVAFLVSLVVIPFLTACQSASISAPGPFLESPLAGGKENGFGGQLGVRNGTYVEVTRNAGERPTPSFDSPQVSDNAEGYGGISYAATKRFDLRGDLGLSTNFSLSLLAKYQLLGDPIMDSKKWNFPVSVYGYLTSASASRSGDQAATFGPGGFPWKASLGMSGIGLGISSGYQVSDNFMPFVAASREWLRVTYKVDQDESRDGTSPAASFSGTQAGSADAIGLGANFINTEKGFSFFALYSIEKRYWSHSKEDETWRWSGGMQLAF